MSEQDDRLADSISRVRAFARLAEADDNLVRTIHYYQPPRTVDIPSLATVAWYFFLAGLVGVGVAWAVLR
jgi:hypothetical protein